MIVRRRWRQRGSIIYKDHDYDDYCDDCVDDEVLYHLQ